MVLSSVEAEGHQSGLNVTYQLIKARRGEGHGDCDQQCCEMLETVTGGCNYGAGPRRRYQLLYQGHYVSSDGPPPATLTVPSTLGHHRNYAGTGTNITSSGTGD